MNDRDYTSIRGRAVLHSVARNGWVCGICGSRLATRWFDVAPNWRTVCANDQEHDKDEFVTSGAYARLEHERMMEAHDETLKKLADPNSRGKRGR